MRLTLRELKARPDYHAVLARGRLVDGGTAVEFFEPGEAPAAPKIVWPFWARTVARLRQDGEIGVGDTVARLAGNVGGEAFKRTLKDFAGIDCGCVARQEDLNRRFPYPLDGSFQK